MRDRRRSIGSIWKLAVISTGCSQAAAPPIDEFPSISATPTAPFLRGMNRLDITMRDGL